MSFRMCSSARREWNSDPPPHEHREWWLYRLAWRRTIELMRAALGPEPQRRPRRLRPLVRRIRRAVRRRPGRVRRPGSARPWVARRCRILVRQAIERLEPLDRDIVFLRFYEHLPFKAIATIVGLEPNTANQRCVRALLKLKKYLPEL